MKALRATALCALVVPAAVLASPIDSTAPTNIFNRTNSEILLGESSDNGLIWVLPPRNGASQLASTLPFLSQEQCRTLYQQDRRMISNTDYQAELSDNRRRREDAVEPGPGYDDRIAEIQRQFDTRNKAALADREQIITNRDRLLEGWNVAPPKGATLLRFVFSQPWTANLEQLKRDNPGKRFAKLPLLEGSNIWTLPEGTGARFLHFGLAGNGAHDPLHQTIISQSGGNDRFQAQAVGNYQLACFDWFQPNSNSIPLTLQVLYKYQVKTSVHFLAKYNLYRVYSSLLSSGRSSGLFTSSSWQKFVESEELRTAITFDWRVTDAGNNVPPDKRKQVEDEVRQYLVGSVPSLLVSAGVVKPADIEPGKPGAPAVGQALSNGCGANAYCQAGALAFTVLGAAFSSSSQSSEVQRKLNVVATYESRAEEMRIRYGTVDFLNSRTRQKKSHKRSAVKIMSPSQDH